MVCVSEINQVLVGLILIVYMAIEYWLGRTQKTKAGSMIEFFAIMLGFVLVQLFRKKPKEG